MNAPPRRPGTRAAALLFAAALLGAGCGGDTVRVTGRLVVNGQPHPVNPTADIFALDFLGTVDGREFTFPATMSPDGTFTVGGAAGGGIPRGRYRISVMHSGPGGAGGDKFQGRYMAAKTPLAVDITESCALTIDLGTATVTK